MLIHRGNAYISHVCVCAQFSYVQLFTSPWTVACQAPLPWNFPGKNTGGGCHFLLQEIFPTQGLKLCLFAFPVLVGRFFTTVPPGKMPGKTLCIQVIFSGSHPIVGFA